MTSPLSVGLDITRMSSAERLASALRAKITGGELAPGTSLPESVLVKSSTVSRNTVREAIRILVREGLVTHVMHRGSVVIELTEEEISEIYRVRQVLELAAIEASARATDGQLKRLAAAMSQLEQAGKSSDAREIVEQDLLFHQSLVELLDSKRLNDLFQCIQGILRFCLSILSSADREYDDPEPIVAEHRAVYDALVDGRLAEARELMRHHLTINEHRLKEIQRERVRIAADQRRT